MAHDHEALKVQLDAVMYGTGYMKDGKHVPHEDVYLDPRDALIEQQAARIAELEAEVSKQGHAWANVLDLSLVGPQHHETVRDLIASAKSALGDKQ